MTDEKSQQRHIARVEGWALASIFEQIEEDLAKGRISSIRADEQIRKRVFMFLAEVAASFDGEMRRQIEALVPSEHRLERVYGSVARTARRGPPRVAGHKPFCTCATCIALGDD